MKIFEVSKENDGATQQGFYLDYGNAIKVAETT